MPFKYREQLDNPPISRAVRNYTSRSGISLNLEQQITPNIGFFARTGLANGNIEPFDTTDIHRTVAAGFSISGKQWGRPDDTWGIAVSSTASRVCTRPFSMLVASVL
jgi:hypothetical protein